MAKTQATHKPYKAPAKKRVKQKIKLAELEQDLKLDPAESKPESKEYTHADWQKEVAKHCKPGSPIPDWLAAKAP